MGWFLFIVGFMVIGHVLSTTQMRQDARDQFRPYGRLIGAVALIVLALWIAWPPVTDLTLRAIAVLLLVWAAALVWTAAREISRRNSAVP